MVKKNLSTLLEKNIIVLIHKRGGTENCDDYTAIYLTSSSFKLWTNIIEGRLREFIERKKGNRRAIDLIDGQIIINL